MIHKMFTVYDSKAEAYLQPFFSSTKGLAIRSFQETVRNPEHHFNKHAEDFTLFEIGEYDDSSASVEMHQTPVSLGTALEHKLED
tara:strand:+ start:411 stop:665 length:255 start_codon:yes stop_codon:yes gene_type:complete